MGFFGDLVSAVKGAVAKVATVVTQVETAVSNAITGLAEIGTSMLNLAGEVSGAITDFANAYEDGEIDDEEKKKLLEDINKVYVGASILSDELKNSDAGKFISDPTSTFNWLNDKARNSDFNKWLNNKEDDSGLTKWFKDEVHDKLKMKIIRTEASISTGVNTVKGTIEFVAKPVELDGKELWRDANGLFGKDGLFRTGKPDAFINAQKQNLQDASEWLNELKGIPGQIVDDVKTTLTPSKIYDWCSNPDMSLEDATKWSQSALNTAMLVDGGIKGFKSLKTKFTNKEFSMDPVDAVTGSLYIPAIDIVLPDIHEEFKIERKYESINSRVGLLGIGWTNNFETCLNIVGEKVNVLCSDGHIETFYQIEDEWVNDKGGAKIDSLSREKDCWIFKSFTDKRTSRYDNKGKLIDITDKHNNKLSLTYIGENIKTLTTFSNYKLFFTYKDGKVIEIRDELNRTVQYKYNGDYLTDVVHVDKGITRYTYDEKGYISSITDQNGNTYTKNFFDKKGRVIKQEYPNGDVAEASYDDGEKENTFYYHGSKRIEKTRYNRDNLITHNIYGDGTTEEYKYDDYQNKIYIKDRNRFETHRVYNEFGSLLKEILPNGLITEYTYDENENLIKQIDNEGKEIIYTYDSEDNLKNKKTKTLVGEWKVESYTYDSKGRILSKTDGNGNTSKYEYDLGNFIEGKQGKDPVRVITNSGYSYQYDYDEVGRNTEIKTDYGTIEFGYNNLNYVASIKDANGNVTIKNYDNMGNLTSLYTPNSCIKGSMSGEGYKYKYDHVDNLISIKNPLGVIEKNIRDTEGNIIKEINPNYYSDDSKDGLGVEYVYDKDNRKIKTIHPDGGIERIFYDSNGNVIRHISPEYYNKETDDGLGYSYTYDQMNRLSSIVNEEGITEKTFEYDLHGNITKEIDNEGNATLFKYDLLGNMIEKRVPVEIGESKAEIKYNLTCYAYDKNSNKILEKHGTNLVKEDEDCNYYHEIYFEYDKENRLTDVKDKYGAKTRYKYDCLNNKIYESFKINDATTKIIHYNYDKVGNLIEKKEEIDGKFVSPETKGKNIWAITKYEYDKNGNITKIITPKGYEIGRVYDEVDRVIEQHEKDETSGIFRSHVYTYDNADNVIALSEYSGEAAKVISNKYVSENNYRLHWTEREENKKENKKLFEELKFQEDKRKKTYTYDFQNRLTHFVNVSGNTTRLFYDKNDRIIKQVLPEQYDETKDDGVGTTYSYNLKGKVIEVKNALGETVTKNTYDPKGNIKTSIDGENNKVEYTYTLLGQIKDIVTPNSKKENKTAQSYKYDARGNITGITDGNGNKTSYSLDDWGRIIQITTPEGNAEKYTYDYAGNVTSTTDANGGTIEYFYNSLGQVCEIKDQEGNSEYFYYDNEGNLSKHIDRNQNHVDRKYNVDRNIVDLKAYQIDEEAVVLGAKKAEEEKERDNEETKKKAEERFENSALTEAPRRRSFTERIKEKKEKQELEEQSPKIEKVEDPDRNKLNIVNQRFKYNPDGTLKNAYTGNMQYEYSYNIEGMLEAKSASGKTLLRYTYDKNNNIKTIKDITGKSSIYSYDEANRVELIQDDNQNNLATYDYYKNNNIKSVTVGNGLKTDYTYDSDGNVQSLVTISSTGEVLVDYNYAYDLNGNRLQKVSSKHKNYYTYDSMNRVKDSSYDDRCESFTYDKVGNRLTKTTNDITEKYVYNVKNQLKELHNKNGINYFTHDKQGNTIKEETQAGNNIFEYNTLNQQVKAITKEGNTLVSRYDTEGLRAEIEENEKLTKFIFHKENVLVETDKDFNSISRFTRGYEVVAADISNGGLASEGNRYYYTQDEHGSTIFITDRDQNVKNEYWYDAFGNVLDKKEDVHNRITYAGQQFDGITGQYYLRARFYNPVVGRFTQEDVYRGDGLNLYAYCGNNPVGYYDPSGYSSLNKERPSALPPGDTQLALPPGKTQLGLPAPKGGINASPSEIAQSWQGSPPYTGVDRYKDITLKKGKIIYAGDPSPTGYATTSSALKRTGNDASKIFQGLQVGPWKAPDEIAHLSGYRQTMMPYEIVEDVPAAFGITKANPQFGKGELPQMYIPEFNKLVEEGKIRPLPDKKIPLENWHVPPDKIQ